MNTYLAVLKKYAVFSGRARRSEYWGFFLINFAIILVLCIFDIITVEGEYRGDLGILGNLLAIYYLAIMVPTIAVIVRRLHDIGRSGWWFFVQLLPLVGSIMLFVILLIDSQPGPNQYGPNPKEMASVPAPGA